MDPDLMPHQKKAVDELSNAKILKGGVGSGKTRTGMAYYCKHYAPYLQLIVITTAKKRDSGDWQEEADKWGCSVLVDSWNNLMSYEAIQNGFFIFDEQRVVGSGVWVKSFLEITKHSKWILLSATPGDTWLDYIPVFIANGFYRNRTEFLREHVVYSRFTKFPKVERVLGTPKLARLLRSILVEMSYEKHTKRKDVDVYVEYDKELFDVVWKRRWNYLEERPIRSVAELFALMRRIVNQDESRVFAVQNLIAEHPRLIVFYNFDYELDLLRTLSEGGIWTPGTLSQRLENERTGETSGSITATAEGLGSTSTDDTIRASFAVAEWNGHKHQQIPETDSWVYLVQYSSGSEAWNCVETDAMVFYSPHYSYRKTEQAKGRIDRLNTKYTDLYYYFLRSSSVIDRAVFSSLAKKQEFNESSAFKHMV